MPGLWSQVKNNRTFLWQTGMVIVTYFTVAKLGLTFATVSAQVTTIWPPSAVAVAVIFLLGSKYWPGIFIASFLTNVTTREPSLVAAGVAVGDTFEAMVVVYFLRRYHFEKVFTALRDGLVFLIASAYGAAVAASIGPVCLILGEVIHPGHFKVEALTWWQGDFMGLLVFGPTILVVLEPKSYDIAKGKFIELGMLLAITLAASMGIFASRGAGPGSLPFLLFPLLVWAAIRFTQLGVVCCATLITCVAIWATAGGLGPFARIPLAEGLFVLQAYACVLMASSMVMATAITERLATELTLIDQAKELGRMDEELKEANRRVTNILEGILQDGTVRRRGNDD